jgi:carbonic anhydrase
VAAKHRTELAGLSDEAKRCARLCELNVVEQVRNVGDTTVVRDAWRRGQQLAVHGWIYDVRDGLLRDLDVTLDRE